MLNFLPPDAMYTTEYCLKLSHLRIAVISDASMQRNGVSTYYYDLIEHLTPHVDRVEMICPGGSQEVDCGRLVFSLPGDSTQKICIPKYSDFYSYLSEFNPHCIIIPTPGPYGLLGLRMVKKLGAGLITGFHTDFLNLSSLYWNKVLGGVSSRYLRIINRLLFRYSSAILANSTEMSRIAGDLGAKKVELMGTLIPSRYLTKPLAFLDTNIKKIMFAGRLAPEKNIEAFIEAAEHLYDRQFIIVGDGPLRDVVKKAAAVSDNIIYLGWQCRERLLEIIDDSDMLVLPSLVESFGTIALEAMARARIVLISSSCGLLDWREFGDTVFSFESDESLGQAIRRIQNSTIDLSKRAIQGNQAAERFNQASLNHWLQILMKCVNTNHG